MNEGVKSIEETGKGRSRWMEVRYIGKGGKGMKDFSFMQ
jgi:hypothetical protein